MKKQFLIIIFCLTLLGISFALPSTSVDGVNLRTGPGEKYPVKMDFPKYYPLKIIGRSGEWRKVVDWQNTSGWVHNSMISSQQTAVVNRLRVNLRSGPGRGYRQVANLYNGYTLKIIKKRGSWYNVLVVDPPGNTTGWIASWLIWG